jgi:hypothetical protein
MAEPQQPAEAKAPAARVKPLPKPDRAALDADLAKHVAAQEKLTAQLADLDAQIKEKNASRKAASGDAASAANRSRLAELNAAFKARMVRAPRRLRRRLAAHARRQRRARCCVPRA